MPQDEHVTLEALANEAFVPKPTEAELKRERELLDDVARLNIQSSHEAIKVADDAAQK